MALPNMLLVTACSLMFVIAAILPKAARLLVRFGFHADFWNLQLMKTCPYFNASLSKDADIVLVCGAGGQAALAGKTLKEMGFQNVCNVGGISDWIAAGGKSEA
jgi:rhodanese-related sulfurtransferase